MYWPTDVFKVDIVVLSQSALSQRYPLQRLKIAQTTTIKTNKSGRSHSTFDRRQKQRHTRGYCIYKHKRNTTMCDKYRPPPGISLTTLRI